MAITAEELGQPIPDDAVRFTWITIDGKSAPGALGIMYSRPTPTTVAAMIEIPQIPELYENQRITLSGSCENRKYMRGIRAVVNEVTKDGSRTLCRLTLLRPTRRE